MPNQALIKPQTLTRKMEVAYPKSTSNGAVSTRSTTTSTTSIITENCTARIIITENITLSGVGKYDSIVLDILDTVILNGQTDATENGLYIVQSGSWTRHDQSIYGGLIVSVREGANYADSVWLVAHPDSKISEFGDDEIVFVRIDSGLAIQESGEDAAQKMGAMILMVSELYRRLCCALDERSYSVVCHLMNFSGNWSALQGVSTTVPFSTQRYKPKDGVVTGGAYYPTRAGFYQVDVVLYNNLLVTPPNVDLWLQIGGSVDIYDCDSVTINVDRVYLQGSRKVWCDVGGSIYAALRHNYAGDVDFKTLAAPGADGYISISYAGAPSAATVI